jgi:hypothetical protein
MRLAASLLALVATALLPASEGDGGAGGDGGSLAVSLC